MSSNLIEVVRRTGERVDIRGRWSLEPAYPEVLADEVFVLKQLERELRQRKTIDLRTCGVAVEIDDTVSPYVSYLLICEAYEYQDVELMRRYLGKLSSAVVLGAGIGFTAAAVGLHTGARVIAVEANAELQHLIRRTAELNRVECEVVCGAVGAGRRQSAVDFHVSHDFWASSLRPDTHNVRATIKAQPVDANRIVNDAQAEAVLIDVEGAEGSLLETMELAAHVRTVIVEIHRSALGGVGVARAMSALWQAGFALKDMAGQTSVWQRA